MTNSQGATGEQAETGPGLRFLWLTLQLGVVLAVLYRFSIQEGFGFVRLLPLIFGGFIVHGLLPMRFRLPFFTLLSIASVAVVVPYPYSLTLIGLAFGLIGMCHLPIAFGLRIALILAVTGFLAVIRGGWLDLPGTRVLETLVLPMLGAMFMFRLAVYLYDLKNEKKPASVWERVSYFFMVPNVCFLLFPVVDYTTYRRSHYKGEANDIYQRGITWIFRGATHLIAYRWVYQYIIPAPGEMDGLGDVVVFVLATYLLYLRISGQFHIIVGILCLFGFNLPGTHRLYYLATSFNDFWRRINIYWKDYMLKLFFYPIYMRYRSGSMAQRLTVSTMVVFLCTWVLHSYQWFWIRGSFPITGKDGLFWGILGVLVIFNSLREAKGTKKTLTKQAWSLREAYSVSLSTLGTFLFICILWSLWSAHSIEEWVSLIAKAGESPLSSWALLLLGLVGVLHLGLLMRYAVTPGTPLQGFMSRWIPQDPKVSTLMGCGALLLFTWPARYGGLSGDTAGFVANLRTDRLNVKDSQLAEQGYYEGLNDAGSFTSALWAGHTGKPKGREWLDIRSSNVSQMTGDLLEFELIRSFNGTWKDAPFQTNRWGMRDGAYTKEKPAGTFRIALIGASMEVAAGVDGDQVYEALIEERLNREYAGEKYERFELLNFAVGGYSMVQKALVARDRIPAFEPDLLILTVHATEDRRLLNHLANVVVQDRISEPYLERAIARSGATSDMTEAEVRELLPEVRDEILGGAMAELQKSCAAAGIRVLTVFLPLAEDSELEHPDLAGLQELARTAGLEPVLIKGAFEGLAPEEILLAPSWDPLHLNVDGNRLLSEAVFARLVEELGLEAH